MKNKLVIACVFLITAFVIYLTTCLIIRYNQYVETDRLIKNDIRAILKNQALPSEPRLDVWGTEIKYDYYASEYARVASGRSAGPDCKFHTSDDVLASKRDYNKSKIVGKWAGQKAKEFGSGLIEGLKDKSPFKKEKE